MGGLYTNAPRGLHGCAAISAPVSRPRSSSPSPSRRRSASPESAARGRGTGRGKGRRGTVRSPPTPSGPPRPYGSPEEGRMGRKKRGTVRASRSPAMRGLNWGEDGGAGGRMLRRFRTKVRQMRHVIAARVLQDTPPKRPGWGRTPGNSGSDSPWEWEIGAGGDELEDLDLLAGMASNDTDYRKVRSRLNGQILELMAADVTEWLPRYCLPSVIARVEPKKVIDSSRSFSITSYPVLILTPSYTVLILEKEASLGVLSLAGAGREGEDAARLPTVHHFVMTVPRKGLGMSSLTPRNSHFWDTYGSSRPISIQHGRRSPQWGSIIRPLPGLNRQESDRRWATAKPAKGAFPVAIDRHNNIVLHGACATVCVCALSFDPLFDTLRATGAAPLEWGLGDAATLKAGRPPLPILPPPPQRKGPSLPTVFAPSFAREASWTGRNAPPLVHFGLPPLVPLDHPVEPLFQTLSSDNVLLALSALICERPVLVTCSVRSLLSVAVSSLKALLHPLGWHHAYAPLLPAAELVAFWKSKVALDNKSALSHGRSGSPPRITAGTWKAGGGERGRGSPAIPASTAPRSRSQTPFLVGLDGELVRMAIGKASIGSGGSGGGGGGGEKGSEGGPGTGEVWGVASSESCMVPPGAEAGSSGVATTQPSSTVLEVVRRMLKQSVHVDLDHDEITWPPPPPPPEETSPRQNSGGGDMARLNSLGFEDKEKDAGGGETGASAAGGNGGAPPVWPEEAARRARRVIQSTLFPEFESFDVVSESPPETVDFDDDSALFKCSGFSGGGAEASLRDKIEASRSSASALTPKRGTLSGGNSGGGGTAGAGTLTESIVGMYVPTPADLALRASAAGLVASVLGRVKEFTTLFAQAGLMRFDTARFVSAVATRYSSGGSKPPAGVNNAGRANNNSAFLGGGGGGDDGGAAAGAAASATRAGSGPPLYPDSSGGTAFSGGGSGGNGAGSAAGQEESAPVVVGGTADDGSSAEGGVGDGGHLWGVPGTEMCLEVVRTRAFAALLSDEVFADVDLETVQAELRLHSRQIRKSVPS
ncbi:unnamed protein product [Scytosiphon promiscuus]